MTKEKPRVEDNALYSIPETMSKLQISKSTLYRYINAGITKAIVRECNNRMYFKGKEITRLWGGGF